MVWVSGTEVTALLLMVLVGVVGSALEGVVAAVVTVGLLSLEALVTMGRPRVRLLLLLLLLMVVAVTLVIPPAVFWFAEEGLGLLLSWC